MKTERTKRGNPLLLIAAVLLILVLVSVYILGGLLARYTATGDGADRTRIAALSTQIDMITFDLGDIVKPGDSKSYPFTVSSDSEVSLRYRLTLSINGSMPLECTLKRGNATVLTTSIAELNAAVSQSKALEKSAAAPVLAPHAPSDVYTLTVTWPAARNNLSYANNAASVLRVYFDAAQID